MGLLDQVPSQVYIYFSMRCIISIKARINRVSCECLYLSLYLSFDSTVFRTKPRDFQIGKTNWFQYWSTRNQVFLATSSKTKARESLVVQRLYGVTHVVAFQNILQPCNSGKLEIWNTLKHFDHIKTREFLLIHWLYSVTLVVTLQKIFFFFQHLLRNYYNYLVGYKRYYRLAILANVYPNRF